MKPHLQDLLEQLQNATVPAPDPHLVRSWRDQNKPLVERLQDVLDDIPIDVQRAGLQLRFLQERLAGRTRGCRAHHAEIAAALRQLGFRRERKWRNEDHGFRALWIRD